MKTPQQSKARTFLTLHRDRRLLVLPNIWDPIGARLLAAKGFPAVATASAAVSASLGFADGERIRLDTLLALLRRITRSVPLPVSADIEAGFADSPESLRETMGRVIETGVVGVNIEDSLVEGGPLRTIDEQCVRIAAARETASECRVPLVINARVDSFLSDSFRSDTERRRDTVTRAKHYADAGADCVYPIGPGDGETLRFLRDRIEGPLNILMSPDAAPLTELQDLGINRVSFGPFLFRACLGRLSRLLDACAELKADVCFAEESLTGAEIEPTLNHERESENTVMDPIEYYQDKLAHEMDAWDLSETLRRGEPVVVLDVRSPQTFEAEHIPGALNVPHRSMTPETTGQFDRETLYVTYCDGIGCNGSTKGALNMARMGFKVKELIGGMDWWRRDGHPAEAGAPNKDA